MRKVVWLTIVAFCAILAVAWVMAERANPKFIDVDPAKVSHH
jgi:hypothetical protein